MPDDERTRRRLGDETKGRIADLASGWDSPGEPSPRAPDPVRPATSALHRPPQKTTPPPPPGSTARNALDDLLGDMDEEPRPAVAAPAKRPLSLAGALDALDESGQWDEPAPKPAAAPKPVAAPKPAAPKRPSSTRSAPTESGAVDVSGLIDDKTEPPELLVPPPTVDASALGTRDTEPPPIFDRSLIGKTAAMKTAAAAPPAASAPPVPRSAPRTSPPPPPGARPTGASPAADRPPPPAPIASGSGASAPHASASGSAPPPSPIPRGVRASFVIEPAAPASSAARSDWREPESLETIPELEPDASSSQIAVPTGEFDASRPRDEQATVVKQAPAELLRAETGELLRAETGELVGRADPTLPPDATELRAPSSAKSGARGRLRTIAQLRRVGGVGGDMRYVLTVIFGVRRSRRELAALDATQATRQQSRRRHLTTLGRTAVSAVGFEHSALPRAREQLAKIEAERVQHTGQVAAADAEMKRVTADRDGKAKQFATDSAAIDGELAALAKKIEPLEKEIAGVTRRAAGLRDSMRRLDEKIAATEASLTAPKTTNADRPAIQAEIASLKADRKGLQADEPTLAGELDSLHPRLASLEAARADARRRRADLEEAEQNDQRRTDEVLAAIGAKRKVVDRAVSDAEAARDKVLFELGERLYVDRPQSMTAELSPIDAIDVELGTGDRRSMELREILQSIDRWKFVRGAALWLLVLAAIGGAAYVALFVLQ